MQLVLQLYSYPGDYLSEKPSAERMAETVEKFEEDIYGAARPKGRRRARVRLGEPIDLRFRKPKRKPLRLVALLDASGSMELYVSVFTRFLHAVAQVLLHFGLERGERLAGDHIDVPGLQVAAGGRARSQREHLADGFRRHRIGEEGPDGTARGDGGKQAGVAADQRI